MNCYLVDIPEAFALEGPEFEIVILNQKMAPLFWHI